MNTGQTPRNSASDPIVIDTTIRQVLERWIAYILSCKHLTPIIRLLMRKCQIASGVVKRPSFPISMHLYLALTDQMLA